MNDNIFVRLKTDRGIVVDDYKPYFKCYKVVPVKQIPVRIEKNDEDWNFAWIKRGEEVIKGKKVVTYGMAVF